MMNQRVPFILILLFVVILSVCWASQPSSASSLSPRERISNIVKDWARHMSGLPVNCMPMQFLFNGYAVVQSSNETVSGLSSIYNWCKARWETPYKQVEVFVTGELFVDFSKENKSPPSYAVAFDRTILLVNHNFCRVSWHGITELEFDEEFRITKWKDFFNVQELELHLKDCEFPSESELLDANAPQPPSAKTEL